MDILPTDKILQLKEFMTGRGERKSRMSSYRHVSDNLFRLFVYSFSFCGAVPSRCFRSTYQLCIWTSITLRHQEHSMDVRNNTIRKREHKEQSRIRHNSSRSYQAH